MILLSASRNQQALDEVPTLVQALKISGVDVVQAMHNVREQVEQQARLANPPHEQRPALVEELDGSFFFFPKPGAAGAVASAAMTAAPVTATHSAVAAGAGSGPLSTAAAGAATRGPRPCWRALISKAPELLATTPTRCCGRKSRRRRTMPRGSTTWG